MKELHEVMRGTTILTAQHSTAQHSTAQHSTADKTGIFFRLLDYNSKRKGHLYPIRGDDASVLFRYNGWFHSIGGVSYG